MSVLMCNVQLDDWLDYDFPTDIRSAITGSWKRYRGQTQKWYDTDASLLPIGEVPRIVLTPPYFPLGSATH